MVDAEFHDTLTDAPVITEVAAFNPIQACCDPDLGPHVNPVDPVIEGNVTRLRLEFLDDHGPMYTLVYIGPQVCQRVYDANRDMVTGVYSSGACVTTSSGSMP